MQIAAEELDVAPGRIDMVSGLSDESPFEGFTSGSNSTEVSGASVRLVCAEVRSLFLHGVAELLGCALEELSVEDGRFLRDRADTGHDYWNFADRVDLGQPARGSVPVKAPEHYRVVGTSVPRADLEEKIHGAAFIHDLLPQGLLHARVLHRPWLGARLADLDEAALRRLAGCHLDICRDGDFVGFLAEDECAVMRVFEAARQAAVWEGGTPPPDEINDPQWQRLQTSRDRTLDGEPLQPPAPGTHVQAMFSRPFIVHASIGLVCALARFDDGRLTVWTQSQGIYALRESLARTLDLDVAHITVRHRPGAGCYGHNGADDAAFDAAFLAKRYPGRPVRVQWSRQDELAVSPVGSAMNVGMDATLDAAGYPASWRMDIWSTVHGRRPGMHGNANLLGAEALAAPLPLNEDITDIPDATGGGATRNAVALYDLPKQEIVHHQLMDIPVRSSTIRGQGSHVNTIAIECFLDELAENAGIDPVEYRLALTSDPRIRQVIEAVAEMADWRPLEAAGQGTGRGFGFGRYKNRAAYMAVVADVEVEEEVRIKRIWASVDAGMIINPDGAENQIEGGIIQAASWTLKERVRFEGGRIVTDTWETYPIMRFSEVPPIDIRLIDTLEFPALGIGEAAVGPTAAALVNAASHALGVRLRDLPLSRDNLMNSLLAS